MLGGLAVHCRQGVDIDCKSKISWGFTQAPKTISVKMPLSDAPAPRGRRKKKGGAAGVPSSHDDLNVFDNARYLDANEVTRI